MPKIPLISIKIITKIEVLGENLQIWSNILIFKISYNPAYSEILNFLVAFFLGKKGN
jgi:hypothetical protein